MDYMEQASRSTTSRSEYKSQIDDSIDMTISKFENDVARKKLSTINKLKYKEVKNSIKKEENQRNVKRLNKSWKVLGIN